MGVNDPICELFASDFWRDARLYYQYNPNRVSACPLTIHALLHIPDGIEQTGPVWVSWAFPTERFCGRLLPVIKSWRHPFANLDNYVVASAQLWQIKLKYNLHEALLLGPRKGDEVNGSFVHADRESSEV